MGFDPTLRGSKSQHTEILIIRPVLKDPEEGLLLKDPEAELLLKDPSRGGEGGNGRSTTWEEELQ